MDIISQRVDGVLVVTPEGRLDAYGAMKLDETLDNIIQDEDSSVVFNMEGVSYLSSGGIRSFLRAERMMRDRGGQIKLCNLNPYPLEVLKMAGFDQISSPSIPPLMMPWSMWQLLQIPCQWIGVNSLNMKMKMYH